MCKEPKPPLPPYLVPPSLTTLPAIHTGEHWKKTQDSLSDPESEDPHTAQAGNACTPKRPDRDSSGRGGQLSSQCEEEPLDRQRVHS